MITIDSLVILPIYLFILMAVLFWKITGCEGVRLRKLWSTKLLDRYSQRIHNTTEH
jgi:hypothetical protein